MKKCGLLPNKMTKTFEHLPGDDLKRLRLCRWLRRRRRNFAERLISIGGPCTYDVCKIYRLFYPLPRCLQPPLLSFFTASAFVVPLLPHPCADICTCPPIEMSLWAKLRRRRRSQRQRRSLFRSSPGRCSNVFVILLGSSPHFFMALVKNHSINVPNKRTVLFHKQ